MHRKGYQSLDILIADGSNIHLVLQYQCLFELNESPFTESIVHFKSGYFEHMQNLYLLDVALEEKWPRNIAVAHLSTKPP